MEVHSFWYLCRDSLNKLKNAVVHDLPLKLEIIEENPNEEKEEKISPKLIEDLKPSRRVKREKKYTEPQDYLDNESKRTSCYCSLCGKTFPYYLLHHLVQKKHVIELDSGFTCKLCPKLHFKSRSTIVGHFKYCHLIYKTPTICERCGFPQKSAKEAEYHRKTCKLKVRKEYECHFCSKRVVTRQKIHYHILTCHLDHINCKHCSKLISKKDYPEHLQVLHPNDNESSLTCTTCNYTTNSQKRLYSHMNRVHQNEGEYPCELCGKVSKSLASLKKHMYNNHQEKNFKCTECDAEFVNESKLKVHVKQVHLGEKPVQKIEAMPQCEICGKKSWKLKIHMTLHSNERPFKCTLCDAAFKTINAHKKHMYSHSKTRPYNCLKCETGYYRIKYLQKHYQRDHGITYTHKETHKNCRKVQPVLPVEPN